MQGCPLFYKKSNYVNYVEPFTTSCAVSNSDSNSDSSNEQSQEPNWYEKVRAMNLAKIDSQYNQLLSEYLNLNFFKPKINILLDLLRQGVPASIGMMMISVGVFIILFFIGQYVDLAIAGYGTAIRYEQIYLLPVLGLNTAVLSMVGQNFGAKQIIRVNQIYDKALILGCSFMFFAGFVIFFTAEFAVGLFTNDLAVINYGTKYLQITALMEPIYPIFWMCSGAE